MSITVSSGSGIVVVIAELLESGRGLDAFVARADAAHDTARAALLSAQADVLPVAWWLVLVTESLGSLAGEARRLAAEVKTAADTYTAAERAALALQHGLMRRWYDRLLEIPGPLLEETGVETTRSGAPFVASAPAGFASLAERIPTAAVGAPQVRVEKYVQDDGERRWVVYSSGTASWSPVAGADPWDLTADASAVETGRSASADAAMQALEQAGWRPGDEVLPVGHSQGGLVATAIASSGAVAAPMLVTFGSPTRQVAAPRGTLDVAVEHTDDPVPLTGGSFGVPGDRRVTVREAAPPVPKGSRGFPAHSMVGYEETAREMDESDDARLVAARQRLTEFTGGKEAEVTLWQGVRVRAPSSAAPIGSEAPSDPGAW